MTSAKAAGRYLAAYVVAYRQEFEALTANPPEGAGYPRLAISPYVEAPNIECLVAADGAVILFPGVPPAPTWAIAGGPALMVDTEPTRTPGWVTDKLKRAGLLGKFIGIYRIVGHVSEETWAGTLPPSSGKAVVEVTNTTIDVAKFDIKVAELVDRLTFGAIGSILDLHLPDDSSDFWHPHIIRNLGFMTADRNQQRFVEYMEVLHHGDDAAWDPRSIRARVVGDVRRDYAHAATAPPDGATLALGTRGGGKTEAIFKEIGSSSKSEQIARRFEILVPAIQGFRELLRGAAKDPERTFQNYLEEHPVLLDAYATAVARPRFMYPPGSKSPVGKSWVEPDFVLTYPGHRYKLVEIERPGKSLGTSSGRPSADVTQPAFQLAEWRDFIRQYPAIVEERFPGLPGNFSTMLVVSRRTREATGKHDPDRYLPLVQDTYAADQVYFFDDLTDLAEVLQAKLQALTTFEG